MVELSPEQQLALQKVVDNIAVHVSGTLDLPLEQVEAYILRISQFLRVNSRHFENMKFVLVFAPEETGAKTIDVPNMLVLIRSGKSILYVDMQLRLVKAVEGGIKIKDCCILTSEEKRFCMLINGTYSREILCGQYLDEVDMSNPGAEEPVYSKWHRRMVEFELLAKDHYDEWLARQQHVKYWADRRKRTLMAGPDGTERIFHQSLFSWLKMFVQDKLKIYAEPTTMGQDKTDIIVVTMEGSYVIEVKWMGTNENRQKYDEDRIDEGLVQVGLYLDNDPSLTCGYLVIYDGRSEEQHKTLCRYTPERQHTSCQKPLILFLVSETPSEVGPRIVAGKTK